MILLISSGFIDKLCKAPDVYQRIHTTLTARVGGTGGQPEGGRGKTEGRRGGEERRERKEVRKVDGCNDRWMNGDGQRRRLEGAEEGGGRDVGLKLSETTPSKERERGTEREKERAKSQGRNL